MTSKRIASQIPCVPFGIYFLDSDKRVSPKRMYAVTGTRTNGQNLLEFYVKEFKRYIIYDVEHGVMISKISLN